MKDLEFLRRWEMGILIGLLLAAFALRVLSLADVPPGLRYDELQNHLMASRVMAGERPLYFSESWGHEPLYHYMQAATMSWFGESDWNLRLPSVFLGVLEVAATWLVARKLFGRRVGLLAAAFLTVSFWGIFYSRIGSRVGSTTFFVALMVYFLWQTYRSNVARSGDRPQRFWHGWLLALVGGLFMGTAVYVYVAGRVAFGIFAGFVIYLAVFHWREFKQAWVRFLLFGVVGFLVAMPLFVELRNQPALEQRLDLLNAPLDALKQGDPLPVVELSVRAWGMYVMQGEQDWLYNVSGRPIFDGITAVFFLLGIGLAGWRWRQSRYALMLIWLVMGTAPAMLAPPEASLTHTIAAQPVAFILLALGVALVWRWLDRRQPVLGIGLVIGLFVFFALSSGLAYFGTWSNDTEVRELYQGGIGAVANAVADQTPPEIVAIGAPFISYWQPWNAVNFELALAEDASQVRWFNPAGGWVWPESDAPVVYYFPTDPLGPQQYESTLQQLFLADAESIPVAGDDYQAYRVTNPALFAEKFEQVGAETAVSVNFDDRLLLQGVDMLTPVIQAGEPLRFITYWQVLRQEATPLVAFAHLTDDGAAIWAQQDWLDVRAESLQPGDRFVQIHQLQVNPETPLGAYSVQLGLYGPDTLVRLPIRLEDSADSPDHIVVGQVEVAE